MARKSTTGTTKEKSSSSKASQRSSSQKDLSEEVRKVAYGLYEKRGCTPGRDLDDWLEAEKQIKKRIKA
ncbi:MAG: hypothetical protein A2149_05045 [Candidatus Schekmanbacteria bacterium RBG_16_38_11]|uniref:DUF2934 domain-containing protein n=1 Tax=Candidatus Schekmanbacteria bacterium RBG_16_38_11 TaxID=1817880 RepID=A0A1F7RZ30_9BACT|nr:MAG: hypothetical protein A2149_05045 [Candidatus Schekmanbacteria bacterium RBG_16_38_11]